MLLKSINDCIGYDRDFFFARYLLLSRAPHSPTHISIFQNVDEKYMYTWSTLDVKQISVRRGVEFNYHEQILGAGNVIDVRVL